MLPFWARCPSRALGWCSEDGQPVCDRNLCGRPMLVATPFPTLSGRIA
jgi:hypothetical protein